MTTKTTTMKTTKTAKTTSTKTTAIVWICTVYFVYCDYNSDEDGRPDENKSTAHAKCSLNEVGRLLKEVSDRCGWQVLDIHSDGSAFAREISFLFWKERIVIDIWNHLADETFVTDSLLCKLCWVHPHILTRDHCNVLSTVLFHFVYGASPQRILLHLPIILLHFLIKFA